MGVGWVATGRTTVQPGRKGRCERPHKRVTGQSRKEEGVGSGWPQKESLRQPGRKEAHFSTEDQ